MFATFNIICGFCYFPDNAHKSENDPYRNENFDPSSINFDHACDRSYESIIDRNTRYETESGHFTIVDIDATTGAVVTNPGQDYQDDDLDPWFVEFDSATNQDAIDSYRDTNPNEITWASDCRSNKSKTSKAHPHNFGTYEQQRNVYVDGFDGFMTVDVYDEVLTRKFQAKLLNTFKNKKGNLQVGGVELVKVIKFNDDEATPWSPYRETVDARCVRNDCPCVLNTGWSPLITREEMEQFTLDVIRHGNNHAASWFTQRDTFYKVHADHCDLNCDPKAAHCPVPVKFSDELELDLSCHFANASTELLDEIESYYLNH